MCSQEDTLTRDTFRMIFEPNKRSAPQLYEGLLQFEVRHSRPLIMARVVCMFAYKGTFGQRPL